MRDVTLKAYMRSYLVGSMSKVLSDTSSTSILCVCEKRRLLVHLYCAVACDFQQCDILKSVDSDQPVQHPFTLRNSK